MLLLCPLAFSDYLIQKREGAQLELATAGQSSSVADICARLAGHSLRSGFLLHRPMLIYDAIAKILH